MHTPNKRTWSTHAFSANACTPNEHAPDTHTIAVSKKKLLLTLAGCCLFVALGGWMLQDADAFAMPPKFDLPWLRQVGMGALTVLFFGGGGAVVLIKLFDKAPGLTLNAQGIYMHNFMVHGIPWSDIAGFGVCEVNKQKMLVIKLRDPKKYIESGNAMQRKINRLSTQICGSPIALSANTLQIGFDDLQTLCNRYWTKYGKRI